MLPDCSSLDLIAAASSNSSPRKGSSSYTADMLCIYDLVKAIGKPNFMCARVQLPSNLNFAALDKHTSDYHDRQVVDFLRYGFPISYKGPIPTPTYNNHGSARNYPTHFRAYVDREVAEGALLGPFNDVPFKPWAQVNPLMSRPKRDSAECRIIVDLSWPPAPGCSVNGGDTQGHLPQPAVQAHPTNS